MSVSLPRLGLGCAPLGNLFQAMSDEDAHDVLQAAWDAGVRHFDTAPHYGLGLSELRLGRFLADKPRDEFVVSTKVGRLLRRDPLWDGVARDAKGFDVPAQLQRVLDYTEAGVRASLADSLDRLQMDRVDILYVHDPEFAEAGANRAALAALAQLRSEGTVDAIGTGSMAVEPLAEAVDCAADVLMVAGRFTMLDQSIGQDVLEQCVRRGVRIVAAAVFHSGLLAAKPSPDSFFNYDRVPADVLAKAQRIADVCTDHGVELGAAALHYPLRDARAASVVFGANSPDQVRQNVERFDSEIPTALWDELASEGLVPR